MAFALLSLPGESCRRGRGQSQDNRKLIYIDGCDKRITLTSGRTSQFIILPFVSGSISARALVPGLTAPGGRCSALRLVPSCPSGKYHLL